MIARLEFDLSNEDDKDEFELMQKASKMLCAIEKFKQELRSIDKYGREGFEPATVEKIRDFFLDTLNEYEVNL